MRGSGGVISGGRAKNQIERLRLSEGANDEKRSWLSLARRTGQRPFGGCPRLLRQVEASEICHRPFSREHDCHPSKKPIPAASLIYSIADSLSGVAEEGRSPLLLHTASTSLQLVQNRRPRQEEGVNLCGSVPRLSRTDIAEPWPCQTPRQSNILWAPRKRINAVGREGGLAFRTRQADIKSESIPDFNGQTKLQ